jgi:excisionase family DNA binding protein
MQRGKRMSERTTKLKITETKFSMGEVAKLIGVHRTTIMRLLDAGKLGCYQIGDRRIVAETHLQEFLLLAERKATVNFALADRRKGPFYKDFKRRMRNFQVMPENCRKFSRYARTKFHLMTERRP